MKAGPLAGLGELSKPATVLIEKISGAIGVVFEPYQIKRIARAEAEADKIKAVAQIELTEIQRRAMVRMVQEEGKKQENIESISAQAASTLNEDAKPENIEDDWIAHFFDKCKLVSDSEMRGVWARILSGEANSPGSFSKRTVDVVASLDKPDAELFTQLCSFAWMIGSVTPLVFDSSDSIYTDRGINFNTLTHLETLGLLRFGPEFGFLRHCLQNETVIFYYGSPFFVGLADKEDKALTLGEVLLSQAGQQLAPICGSKPLPEFPEYVAKKWADAKISMASMLAKP